MVIRAKEDVGTSKSKGKDNHQQIANLVCALIWLYLSW
ncbi:hypothetical protein V6Z12_D08G134900 [Gossypium hirsutum]